MPSQPPFLISRDTADLAPQVMASEGLPKIMPASFYARATASERMRLCVTQGLYCLPTAELVEYLAGLTANKSALEIGSGNGALAQALGIRATDNRMQEQEHYQAYYRQLGQATVRYGGNVERIDAVEAIRLYRPQVVLGVWVTHRYDPARAEAGGNEIGIDEAVIIENCETYVLVGNERSTSTSPSGRCRMR